MTTSNKVEQFYNTLVKDPELDIKPGQTREQAARMEASYRARQYDNNAKALAMATTPDESPINSLFNHLEQMKKSVDDVVLIKAVEEYSNRDFKDMYIFTFGGGDETAEKGWGFSRRVGKLSNKQKQNLATNIFEYIDTSKDGMSNIDVEAATEIAEHITSLPEELREKVFQTFIKSNPVDISASSSRRDSLLKNKYLARKNAKRLTPAGFAHLLSFNKHGDFKLSNSKRLKDLSNLTNVESIVPKNYNDLKPTQEEIDDYYSNDIFENSDTAKKWFDAQRPQTRRDFGNVSSTADEYHGGMGGTNSLKAADIDDHIANYNKVLDSEGELDYYDNTELTNKHDSSFNSLSESSKQNQADEKDPKGSSDESVGPSATIHGVTLESDYLEDQGDGTYKIKPMAFESTSGSFASDFNSIWAGTYDSEGQTRARRLTPEHKKYLEGLSFKAGAIVGEEPSDASQGSLEDQIKTDRFNTTTSSETSGSTGSKSSSKQKKTEDKTEEENKEEDKTEDENKEEDKKEEEDKQEDENEDESTSPEDDLINKAKESGVFDYLYAKTHGADNPFGDEADFEEELKTMGIDKLKKKLRDEYVKMNNDEDKAANQASKEQDQKDLKQQKADAKTEKQIDSIINSKSFLDKNIIDYINAVGPYESKSNQTKVARERRATLMYQKLMGDLHQISKAGKITRATADKYDAAAAKLAEIGADVKKVQNQYTEFVNKGELTVAGQKVTDFGSEEHMNLLEADFQGLKGDEAKNHKGHFNQYGPVSKLREVDPEGKFWGGPKEAEQAPEKRTSDGADVDEDYEGSDIPNQFRGYGIAPEGVRTYTGPQGGSFYDTREADSKGDSKGSPSIFGGEAYTPQQYGEGLVDVARDLGQAEIDAGKAIGRGVVAGAKGVAAGAKGVAGAATAGAKKIKETGAKVGRAFTDPSPSPIGLGEELAGTVGRAGKTVAGAAAKGAKAAKTQVSESVGADVARATAGAAKEGATKVAGATAAGAGRVAGATAAGAGKVAQAGKTGASKVAQAGKAGIGKVTGAGKKGAGKVSQAGKTASERLREFVSDEPDYLTETYTDDKGKKRERTYPNPKVFEQISPMTSRRKPGKTMSQRFSDLFKADDIENPEGLARWLASKYDGVPTTTKPGEKGWERIQSYLTALKDPRAQHNKGKVNRIRNPQTGQRVRGKLRGSSKVKGPQSFTQRAKDARDRGVSMHELADQGFPQARTDHRGSYTQQEMDKDKHSGGRKTIADKHLGHREGVERRQAKKVKRMVRQAGEMTKQMPSDELIHKQRQDILERLEKLV